jgi:hypothetical protein
VAEGDREAIPKASVFAGTIFHGTRNLSDFGFKLFGTLQAENSVKTLWDSSEDKNLGAIKQHGVGSIK